MRVFFILLFFSISFLNAQITIDISPNSENAFCEMGVSPLNNSAYLAWRNNNGGGVASSACGTINSPWLVINEIVSNSNCGVDIDVEWSVSDDCGSQSVSTNGTFTLNSEGPVWTINPSNITIDCGSATAQNDLNTWLANYGGGTVTDDCSPGSNLSVSNTNNGILPQCGDEENVEFTVSDQCNNGNEANASFFMQTTKIDFVQTYFSVAEDVGTVQICFEALNANLDADATINLQVQPTSSATVGSDYQVFNTTIIFPASPINSTHCFDIDIIDDNIIDGSRFERIQFEIANISSPINET